MLYHDYPAKKFIRQDYHRYLAAARGSKLDFHINMRLSYIFTLFLRITSFLTFYHSNNLTLKEEHYRRHKYRCEALFSIDL